MPENVKVVDARKLPSADPKRPGLFDLLISYQTAAGVQGIVRVPAEAAGDEQVAAAIRVDLDERAGWQGRDLEV